MSRQDAAIARIAATQHGVISLLQLESLGVHRQSVTRRVQRGRLHRIHRAVLRSSPSATVFAFPSPP